jgi:GNAT superfamily N-acetyltransferase
MSAAPHGHGTPLAGGAAPLRIRAAAREDVPVLLEMFRELADYEHLLDQLRADEERLTRALFADPPAASALIAELGAEVVGYAVFFRTFSTFLAIQGVWLEDLFVRPAHRGAGVGRALLAAVAAHLRELGGERLEWAALDWNEPALGFYRRIGAQTMGEWVTHRLVGEELARLAAEAPGGADATRR